MFSRTFQVLASAAFLSLAASHAAAADDCRLARIASFDFSDKGALFVPVWINGTSVQIVFDTGAPASAIDPNVANKLGLPQHRIMQGAMYDIAGQPISYIATIHDLNFGNAHASNAEFVVWPSPISTQAQIGGMLAADLLRHYDVDIDFGAHKLNLFSQDHCPGKVVYWASSNVAVIPVHVVASGHVIVPVKLDGQSFDAVLDTGSTYSFLSVEAASNTFHLTPGSSDMASAGNYGPGGVPVYRHTFKNLDLGGLSFGNPTLSIFEIGAKTRAPTHLGSRIADFDERGGNTDFVLGLSELRHLHLYIAYQEQKLYISPAVASTGVAAASGTAAAH